MPCSVCNHPQSQVIDQALLTGSATLAALSQAHGLSTSALSRHKQHLLAKTGQAQTHFQDLLREGYLFMLCQFLEMVSGVARTAQAAGDHRQLLQATRQATNIMKFMVKLDGSITPFTVHRLLASPQWAAADRLLPTDPAFIAGSRQAIAAGLFAPCPDPGADPPDQLPDPLAGQPRPPAGHRDKSGKKAGQTTPPADNNNYNQIVNQFIAAAGKNPPVPPRLSDLELLELVRKMPESAACPPIDAAEAQKMAEFDAKLDLLDLDPLTQNLSRAEEDVIFDHLYDCGPLPEGKPISLYLQELGLLDPHRPAPGQDK